MESKIILDEIESKQQQCSEYEILVVGMEIFRHVKEALRVNLLACNADNALYWISDKYPPLRIIPTPQPYSGYEFLSKLKS